jgi:hypothetical protein
MQKDFGDSSLKEFVEEKQTESAAAEQEQTNG